MRHLLEVSLFAVSGLAVVFIRSFVFDYELLAFQLVIAVLYFFTVRKWIKGLPRTVASVFRRNTWILVLAAGLCIFDAFAPAVGWLLLMFAVVIAVRAWRYGVPDVDRRDVPAVLQKI